MRFPTETFPRLTALLRPTNHDPAQQLFRLKAVERDIVLPIKVLYIALLIYFFFSPWYGEAPTAMQIAVMLTQRFFIVYLAVNVAVAIYLLRSKRLSLVW